MKAYFRKMSLLLKIMAPVILVTLLVAMIYDMLHPWPLAVDHLGKAYGMQTHLCIGLSSTTIGPKDNPSSGSMRQRVFVLLPRVFKHPEVVVVTQRLPEGTTVVQEDKFAFWIVTVSLLLCAYGTWHYWIIRLLASGRGTS